MEISNRLTREELLRYLRRIPRLSLEDQQQTANTFCQYDRELQDEFLKYLTETSPEIGNS